MKHSQQAVIKVLLAALLLSVSFAAQSAQIRVSQESSLGAGDFDANVLGLIDVFSTGLTIADYYQYGSPFAASYNGDLNGGPAPLSSATQSFFVDALDGLHYVVVHDNVVDGSGGSTRMITNVVGGAGGGTGLTVRDDNAEGGPGTGSDVGSDRIFTTVHNWAPCCTDGYAIGDLGSSFLLLAAFDVQPTGITRWQATSNGLADLALVLDPGRRVRFDGIVPVPAAVWLFGTALLGLFGFSKRRKTA